MATITRRVNCGGIPCLESQGVTVTDSAATFTFNYQLFTRNNFSGLILIKIRDTFTAPATAVPIEFLTSGTNNRQPVLDKAGNAVTTATWEGEGVYLFFYDRENNQLIQFN